jgi:Glycosyl hydrolases family 43
VVRFLPCGELMRTCLYVVAVAATLQGCGSSEDAATAGSGAEVHEGRDAGMSPSDGEAPVAPTPDAGDGGAPGDGGAQQILSPIPRAFADPFVLHAGAAYHLYATNDRGKNVPHVTSANLSSWGFGAENDAMPTLPSWAAPEGIVWAPGVLQVSATRFVLFFASKRAGSAPVGAKGQMCIGSAVATSAAGPFVDTHAAPLYCEASGWSLDPSPFADSDGTMYLVWRQDVNDPARTSAMNTVYVRKLAALGASFADGSTAKELVRRTNGSWEDPIIENPAMVVANGKHYLFYSGNLWRTANYAIGYAKCASAVGPCTKASINAPWLGSNPSIGMTGPGGQEVIRTMGGAVDVTPQGDLLMTMHGWLGPSIESAGSGKPGIRAPWLARLSLAGSSPSVRWP